MVQSSQVLAQNQRKGCVNMSSERIFIDTDDSWYFRIRGNQVSGPYASREQARLALEAYVGNCARRTEPVDLGKSITSLRRLDPRGAERSV